MEEVAKLNDIQRNNWNRQVLPKWSNSADKKIVTVEDAWGENLKANLEDDIMEENHVGVSVWRTINKNINVWQEREIGLAIRMLDFHLTGNSCAQGSTRHKDSGLIRPKLWLAHQTSFGNKKWLVGWASYSCLPSISYQSSHSLPRVEILNKLGGQQNP